MNPSPGTAKKLRIVFLGVLALAVVADLFIAHHPVFGIDDTFAFAAWFALLSCVVMVGVAKVAGHFLQRAEDYYDR